MYGHIDIFLALPILNGIKITFIVIILLALVSIAIYFLFIRHNAKITIKFEDNIGFAYDPKQDIYYSVANAWQKNFGFCKLYDEAASAFHMIVDSEPVEFEYNGKNWMIEFWKGQYGMTCGGEIGLYVSQKYDKPYKGNIFYSCPDERDYLEMSFTLIKNHKILFKRKDKHWWLTGFILGGYAEPHELLMRCEISFRDCAMQNAFIKALIDMGYKSGEFWTYGNTVCLIFDKPHSRQPFTRNPRTDSIIQKKNFLFCEMYNKLTAGLNPECDKLAYIKEHNVKLYRAAFSFVRPLKFYKKYKKR